MRTPKHPVGAEIWRQIERDRRAVLGAFWAEFRQRFAAELARAEGASLDHEVRRTIAFGLLVRMTDEVLASTPPNGEPRPDFPSEVPGGDRSGSPHFFFTNVSAESPPELEPRSRRIQ
jgi:hypothetical protein